MMPADPVGELQAAVARALDTGTGLALTGGGTKTFYGRDAGESTSLAVNRQQGIRNYEPKELVVTAAAGTPLEELQEVLAEQRQMLAFEPPHFGRGATLGGTIACALAGPRRPYAGSARDFVLGMRIVNGRGEHLRFGGEVMKNVAGYDIPRLMAGALGTLGIITEVSLKVLPLPEREVTLTRECDLREALGLMNDWAGRPLPLSACCHDGERLYVRLSGASPGVEAGRSRIGGEEHPSGAGFWESVREQTHPFFGDDRPLWRLSLPPGTPPLNLPGKQWIDWGGAQRWLASDADAEAVRGALEDTGGHATLFRGGDRRGPVFHPLPPALMSLHRSLKQAFDPRGILNPGRLYSEL